MHECNGIINRTLRETELQLNLTREGVEEKLGQLDLTVTVSPLTSGEKDEVSVRKNPL